MGADATNDMPMKESSDSLLAEKSKRPPTNVGAGLMAEKSKLPPTNVGAGLMAEKSKLPPTNVGAGLMAERSKLPPTDASGSPGAGLLAESNPDKHNGGVTRTKKQDDSNDKPVPASTTLAANKEKKDIGPPVQEPITMAQSNPDKDHGGLTHSKVNKDTDRPVPKSSKPSKFLARNEAEELLDQANSAIDGIIAEDGGHVKNQESD